MAFVELGINVEKDLLGGGTSDKSGRRQEKICFENNENVLHACMKFPRNKFNNRTKTS